MSIGGRGGCCGGGSTGCSAASWLVSSLVRLRRRSWLKTMLRTRCRKLSPLSSAAIPPSRLRACETIMSTAERSRFCGIIQWGRLSRSESSGKDGKRGLSRNVQHNDCKPTNLHFLDFPETCHCWDDCPRLLCRPAKRSLPWPQVHPLPHHRWPVDLGRHLLPAVTARLALHCSKPVLSRLPADPGAPLTVGPPIAHLHPVLAQN